MTNDSGTGPEQSGAPGWASGAPNWTSGATGRGSWPRRDNVKIEFGFGVPLGAMAAHPAFHSAWDVGGW